MQVSALRTLRAFWAKHPQAETPLRAWHMIVSQAEWATPADIRAMFNSADLVADRVIFDIGGNKFRLVAHVAYGYRRVLIKSTGTIEDYDKINPETV